MSPFWKRVRIQWRRIRRGSYKEDPYEDPYKEEMIFGDNVTLPLLIKDDMALAREIQRNSWKRRMNKHNLMGRMIRLLRKYADISQMELADRAGVSLPNVLRVEGGQYSESEKDREIADRLLSAAVAARNETDELIKLAETMGGRDHGW